MNDEQFLMLFREVSLYTSYDMVPFTSFFAGCANVQQVLSTKYSTLTANVINITTDMVIKQRKFTISKPQDDATFALMRYYFNKTLMKIALVFKTRNSTFLQNLTTEDATIANIFENQKAGNKRVDIVQINFKSAIITTETPLELIAGKK